MTVKLQIRWDGDVPGLSQHQLSLKHFGVALQELLNAVQITAAGLVAQAEDPDFGARGGRRPLAATLLDLRLTSITDGCVNLGFELGSEVPFLPTMDDLPERTGLALLDAIESESQRRLRNWGVRRFLEKLPKALSQQYQLTRGDVVLKDVRIVSMDLPDGPTELSSIQEYLGQVAGVGFDPGRPKVVLKSGGATYTFEATANQVEAALRLRSAEVCLKALKQGRRSRVLWIREADKPATLSFEESAKRALTEWSTLLERLAQ